MNYYLTNKNMNILIVNPVIIPAKKYGGTERVIWCLGKELTKMGHKVTFLVEKGSYCDFASILIFNHEKSLSVQIPPLTDIVHFNYIPSEPVNKPNITTIHGNCNDFSEFDLNSVFVSQNHANRFGSSSFVYNGLDWDDFGKPNLQNKRNYFHFLGKVAWKVKNVQGAIDIINATKKERLCVLGGYRLNFNMGFRFTFSPRTQFYGIVGDKKKKMLLEGSKGLIFPVRWNEPFGLAITESLYFGCPIFGTPYGSLPEIVNSEIGFLSNNVEVLAKEIENIDRYSRARCHEYALEMFHSKKMAELYLAKYLKVLNGEQLNSFPPKLLKKQTEKLLAWEKY